MPAKMMYSPSALAAFPFAAFFVALTSYKLLHLYMHAHSIPIGHFLLYLPTFFIPDVCIVCAARLLLRRERGLLPLVGYLVGCFLSLITVGAASSQLGFFYETGGEMEWALAGTFANEEGLRVLLSGAPSVMLSGSAILACAWFSRNALYKAIGVFLVLVGTQLASGLRFVSTKFGLKRRSRPDIESSADAATDSYNKDAGMEDDLSEARALLKESNNPLASRCARYCGRVPSWLATTALLSFLAITSLIRPDKPYTHMSTTLPLPLLDIFKAKPDYCEEQARLTKNKWPLPELIEKSRWEAPKDNFKGWAPGTNNKFVLDYEKRSPDWLPTPAPDGFYRWDPERFRKDLLAKVSADKDTSPANATSEAKCPNPRSQEDFYNPVDDPMRITNLDDDILEGIRSHLADGSVKIRHVALIMMESLREELFPIQQGSDVHRFILESHNEADREAINEMVSRMTPNTEKITGKPGNFMREDGSKYDPAEPEWDDKTEPGFGGINIVGGLTTSSASTKSVAAAHCGTWPLAVDMFEESETQSYQPCIPQIFRLFNQLKENTTSEDFLQQQWHPAFFQAVTDGYDRQDKFNTKMGFTDVVAKTRLEKDTKNDPDIKEINYFGFPETALRPYLMDFIGNATANNQRMFLSHFTSTTHHPWQTPTTFNTTKYLRTQGLMKWHEDFNKYLNTIRFHDAWLGELMQIFDDTGISDETLVIFVGDHGQAFKEDVAKTGTYENGHISNFRVPISIRHPKIPRIQYHANATSVSVLPTILDLLINTGSLNEKDAHVASDLINDFEGQSLIRPYKTKHNGRRAWNFGVVNSGGGLLSVTSADSPWRLVMPLSSEIEYAFTDLEHDPLEIQPTLAWSLKKLAQSVGSSYGEDAATWVKEAEAVAKWWGLERKRLWKYDARNKEKNKNKGSSKVKKAADRR